MATKKQKREAAEKKREEFLAKEKAAGLAAQQWDRKRRKAESERIQEQARRINQRFEDTLAGALDRLAAATSRSYVD